jgi:hypothetical protein
MTRPRSVSPSVKGLDKQQAELELARIRQELRMRAFVLAVVLAIVIACTAAAIVGEPSVGNASTGVAGIGLLAWIVRRLFPQEYPPEQSLVHERNGAGEAETSRSLNRRDRPSRGRRFPV